MAPVATKKSSQKRALSPNNNRRIVHPRAPRGRPNTHHCPDKSNGTHNLAQRCLKNGHAGYCQTCGYLGYTARDCWQCEKKDWGSTRPCVANNKGKVEDDDQETQEPGETTKATSSKTDAVTKSKATPTTPAEANTKVEPVKQASKAQQTKKNRGQSIKPVSKKH